MKPTSTACALRTCDATLDAIVDDLPAQVNENATNGLHSPKRGFRNPSIVKSHRAIAM